jgi:hypothetical protein
MPLDVSVPSEQALITFANGREEIVASLALTGAGPQAAVVFPVPADAEVNVLGGKASLFGYLAGATAPRGNQEQPEGAPLAAGAAPGGGVQVVSRKVIGGYDVTTLRADDPTALKTFLDANGYTTPPGAGPILAQYVKDGWSYVAVKLATGGARVPDGQLRPLRISFPSDRIVYPKRLDALAAKPVGTTIYVLAARRVKIDQLHEEYAGPVSGLAPRPPAEFAALFARAPYLTKLGSTTLTDKQLEHDFVFAYADGAGRRHSWSFWVGGLLLVLATVTFMLRQRRTRLA